MKRSEAVKLIEDFLIDNADQELADASVLLTKLEEAGMLPPGRSFIADDGDQQWYMCEWEDE